MKLASIVLLFTASAQSFEVASIKPRADSTGARSGITTGHGRLTAENVTLKRCIMGAYGIGPQQLAGGPSWLDTERFDIAAKSEGVENDDGVLMGMLRTLLFDRFMLRVHRETRTVPALVLEIAKTGSKLENAEDGEASTKSNSAMIDARSITMSRFAEVLSRQTDLPVVDQTGLEGHFNIKLLWRPESPRPTVTGVDEAMERPSLFDALQQQLGLRLLSKKMPIEVLVIDRAEKPSEN